MIAGSNDAGLGGKSRRFVGHGAFEAFANVGKLVNFPVKVAKEVAAADRGRGDEIFQDWQLAKGFAQRD